MTITLYGIPNCDTVKKARGWLDGMGLTYHFHDYKKAGIAPERLRGWVEQAGWEKVLNRQGTTFRKLDEALRSDLDAAKAVALMAAYPSAIKRPIVEYANEDGGGLLVGFDPQAWSTALSGELT
ncbi:arsenate reductase [Novosphingobium lentum]|uniref:arsenate reductase n=1 Tax=Novosphingobium lentum TaxID=145287 RepID=UPI00083314B7|nr:arsenate reductase [Novosphingobium lentum]